MPLLQYLKDRTITAWGGGGTEQCPRYLHHGAITSEHLNAQGGGAVEH